MSERLALVRHKGGVSPSIRVGGIPLAVRHMRMAHRSGITRLRFVTTDQAIHESLESTLRRWPAPEGLSVQVSDDSEIADDTNVLELEASAIYTADDLKLERPEPSYRIANRKDLRGAKRFLFAQIRKSVALDGVISFYVMRPLARLLTHVLLNTKVSPNMVTLGALACGLSAAFLAAMGGAQNAILAGSLYWMGGIIDHVDGELARLRLQSSKAGEWLDSMTDETSTFSLLAGLGIGLQADGYGELWLWLGLGGSVLGALSVARLYVDLHRMKLPIDTAQFPWFFNKEPTEPDASSKGRTMEILGFLLRRDANVTIVSILVALNLRMFAASAIAAGAIIAVLLVTTHYTVIGLRRRAG